MAAQTASSARWQVVQIWNPVPLISLFVSVLFMPCHWTVHISNFLRHARTLANYFHAPLFQFFFTYLPTYSLNFSESRKKPDRLPLDQPEPKIPAATYALLTLMSLQLPGSFL